MFLCEVKFEVVDEVVMLVLGVLIVVIWLWLV